MEPVITCGMHLVYNVRYVTDTHKIHPEYIVSHFILDVNSNIRKVVLRPITYGTRFSVVIKEPDLLRKIRLGEVGIINNNIKDNDKHDWLSLID